LAHTDQFETGTGTSATLHEPFLERAAAGEESGGGGGHALGAFLTMRLVDQFAADGHTTFSDALAYQIASTRDYITNLHPQTVELGHLQEVARVSDHAQTRDDRRLLWPPMLAFAYWLEQEHRLAESLDVIETAFRLSDGRDAEEEIAGHLQLARVCRKLSRYPAATASYREASEMARRRGDIHSELLGRIGQGIVLQKLGNLPQSEHMLRAVIRDAFAHGDPDAEARARHDLSNALMLMGRPRGAVPEAYRAFELYGTEQQRLRALGDLGMAFKMLQNYTAAEDAFSVVIASPACTTDVRINTMLELLDVASAIGDRVGFERCRRELDGLREVMRPDAHVDLRIKLGSGLAAFGLRERGKVLLQEAVQLAEAHQLNAYLFQAEQLMNDFAATASEAKLSAESEAETGTQEREEAETLRVAGELHLLRAGVG